MAEVDISELKPNSFEYRDAQTKAAADPKKERKALKPIVKKENVVSERKPLIERIVGFVASDDTAEAVGYLFESIVMPGIKNLAIDALESFWFGGARGYGSRDRRDRGFYDYGAAYYGSRGYSSRTRDRRDDYDYGRGRDDDRNRDRKSYKNVVLKYRNDAEDVVNRLREQINTYGEVTVFELFSLVDIQGAYTDHNWGWTDPRDIGIKRVSNGYLIDVADAIYLD